MVMTLPWGIRGPVRGRLRGFRHRSSLHSEAVPLWDGVNKVTSSPPFTRMLSFMSRSGRSYRSCHVLVILVVTVVPTPPQYSTTPNLSHGVYSRLASTGRVRLGCAAVKIQRLAISGGRRKASPFGMSEQSDAPPHISPGVTLTRIMD